MRLGNNKGITLIALIVSIIIILILTGVALNSVVGDNGIITMAQKAAEKTKEAVREEELQFQYVEAVAEEGWNGEIAEGFAGGEGTIEKPYKITNGAELAYFAKVVNGEIDPPVGATATFEGKYITIEKNINLGNHEFEPIGKGTNGLYTGNQIDSWDFVDKIFEGFLDGKGNSIVGLKITQVEMYGVGLIGVLGEYGKVENLKLLEGNIVGRYCVGGIVGASKGIINNCLNRLNVTAQDTIENGGDSGECVGGIVGFITKGSILNCRNDGEIIGKDECMKTSRGKCVGGIVGDAYLIDDATISYCENTGKITTQYQQAGGIIGSNEYTVGHILTIENCKNSGEISAKAMRDDLTDTGLKDKLIGFSGGIIGWANSETNIISCSNSGKVTAETQKAGGIVGEQDAGTIKGCTNSGEISTLTSNLAGGIVAWMYEGDESGEKSIENCINKGKVTSGNQQAGGIVGRQDAGTISGCTNSGEISSTTSLAGGIVGKQDAGTIKECINKGKVTSGNQQAGGIVGRQDAGTIKGCTNSGEISSTTSLAGGIVGWMYGTGEKSVEDCTNSGKVTVETQKAGGIVGEQQSGTISLCSNFGEVIANRNNTAAGIAGGIVGSAKGTSLIITKVYNSGKVIVTNNLSETAIDRNGGIVGNILNGQEGLLTYAYNNGELVGGDMIGQVVGRNDISKSVLNCYYYEEEADTLDGIGGSNNVDDSYFSGTEGTTENYDTLYEFLDGIGVSY